MFRQMISKRLFLLSFFIVVGLGAAFYLILGRGTNSTIKQQLLQRQQTIARAEASNIISFFQVFGDSVAVLAQLKSIETRNANAPRDMDAFVEQWRDSDLIGGVVLTDSRGVVQFNSNILGSADVGVSLADRDYFLWAKDKAKVGEYFIGQPVVSRLGASKGRTIVVVASPVYRNGLFTGVVATSVRLRQLTQKYLELMKVSDKTDVYLIDEGGEMLYSNSAPDAIGSNIFELLQKNPFPGSETLTDKIKNALSAKKEGKLKTSHLDPKTGKMVTRLAAYSPITLGSQNWLLAMATPVQEVNGITTPVYIRLGAVLLLVLLTFLLHGVVITREVQTKLG